MMKADQERVRALLTETVALLCKNGLHYSAELRIQGLLGVTVDGDDVFIVHLDECFTGANINLRTSTSNELESHLAVESVNANQSSSTCVPVLSAGYSLGHRQRRKQSSPRRDVRSTQCLEEFEVQEPCLLKESSLHFMSSVDTVSPCVSGSPVAHRTDMQIKMEQPDHADHAIEVDDQEALNIPIKQENSELYNGDVIVINSKDDYHDLSVNSGNVQQRRERAEEMAEEMASNWLTNRLASRVTNYSRRTARCNQRYSIMNSSQAIDRQFVSRSHFDGIAETVPDVQVVSDSKAGCSSWQFSNNIDQLARSRAALPTSQNIIREVSIAHQSPTRYRRHVSTWSRCSNRVGVQSRQLQRKRYECTLDQCGRQYFNTYDLYRHQRQNHQMPADFYRKGKKQTLGIRVVDVSPS